MSVVDLLHWINTKDSTFCLCVSSRFITLDLYKIHDILVSMVGLLNLPCAIYVMFVLFDVFQIMEFYERASGARMHAAYVRPGGVSLVCIDIHVH